MPSKREEIEKRIARIKPNTDETDKEIDDRDRDVLLQFKSRIDEINKKENRFGEDRVIALLDTVILASKYTDIPLDLTLQNGNGGQEAVDAVTDWIDRHYSSNSQDTRYACFRVFGEVMTDGDEMPDRFEELKLNHGDEDPTPQKSEVVYWHEVTAGIGIQQNSRDKAIVATQWSAGGRPMSELWRLTLGDVEKKSDHVVISIPERTDDGETKTGSREIKMYVGAPYLKQWLHDHPGHDAEAGLDPDMPLWTHLNDGYGDAYTRITYEGYRRPFHIMRRETDITKPITPQHFRRSRASVLAAQHFVSQMDLEHRFGWGQNTDSARHYIVKFDEASERRIAAADGMDIELEADFDPIAPVKCEVCSRWTPRHRDTCLWCSGDVPADIREQHFGPQPDVIDDDANLLDMIVDGEITARDLRALQKLQPVLKARTDIWERLDAYIRHAEQVTTTENAAADD